MRNKTKPVSACPSSYYYFMSYCRMLHTQKKERVMSKTNITKTSIAKLVILCGIILCTSGSLNALFPHHCDDYGCHGGIVDRTLNAAAHLAAAPVDMVTNDGYDDVDGYYYGAPAYRYDRDDRYDRDYRDYRNYVDEDYHNE